MNKREIDMGQALEGLLRFAGSRVLTLKEGSGAGLRLRRDDGAERTVPAAAVRRALADGLLAREADRLRATADARGFLRRRLCGAGEEAYGAQHRDDEMAKVEVEGAAAIVRINRAESPLGALARMKDRQGGQFLPEEAVAAGERLHADFTRGQLQPRVTASWEPRLASHGDGARGGIADLTDSALAARRRVSQAVAAIGPDLAGGALDVCCFMKGLETVERERQWPARSAKLLLRAALLSLSRHYHPPAPDRRASTLHWGAEDYRPSL